MTPFSSSENIECNLVKACKRQDRKAQEAVFKHLSGKMMAICIRYLGKGPDSEDALMEGFIKVFSKIDQFTMGNSFEGWIRKIMVNESLIKIRKKAGLYSQNLEEAYELSIPEDAIARLNVLDIEEVIARMPLGYRTVFNLYAIEGYNHQEIAEKLQISEGTSKSQLSRARSYIQEKLKELYA